jgi:hypothetical protein
MNSREFIEKYKNDIIAEPSGRSFVQLSRDKVKEFVLIKSKDR